MHVVHLATTDIGGGAAKAAFRIHQGLKALGVYSQMHVGLKLSHDPDVIGRQSLWQKRWLGFMRRLDTLPRRWLRTDNHSLISPAWADSLSVDFRGVNRADVIQLHWICGGFLRLENLARLRRPVVWRLADMWPLAGGEHYTQGCQRFAEGYRSYNRPPHERGFDLNRWVWQRKLRTYARLDNLTVVAPSRWLAECARKSVLFRDRQVVVIPTGQDIKLFRPLDAAARNTARIELGLPTDKRLVLFGAMNATTDRRKGYELLRDALSQLRQAGPPPSLGLVVFGDSTNDGAELGFPTIRLGCVREPERLAQVYAACDVFVAPSREENLANTVLEAMACGTPVVAFDVGGMPDAIRHEINGYLARPFDAHDLARGIHVTCTADDLRKAWGRQARETIEVRFTVETQAREYRTLYETVLSNVEKISRSRNIAAAA